MARPGYRDATIQRQKEPGCRHYARVAGRDGAQRIRNLSERIKLGLAHARTRGVVLGRRKGTTLTRDKFLQKHKDILRQLKVGQSVRNVAKIVGKGISTIQRVKAALAA
jgi:DNA invertase Pin-like site-specific DNA recombinase